MICDRCGTQVPGNSTSCHNCGHVFSNSANKGTRQGTLMLRRQRKAKAISNLPYKVGDWIDDRYKIQNVLGTGALGGVFQVTDTDLDQDLALKLISKDHLSQGIPRALRQAMRRVKKLSHPNIVRIYEEGTDQDSFYYTMPHLEGLTLAKIMDLRRKKDQFFNLQEVEPILAQIVDALEYAHTTIYHGYLKPQNIIVLPDLLKLTGFGIALALPFERILAAQSQQEDSVNYLAPELRQGSPCDARADIYSLGVLLGEMLTCKNNPNNIPSIQELNPDVNPLIDVVFRRATAPYPEDRYMHVADFMADIISIIDDGELAEDDEVPTLIVSDEHVSELPGMESYPDFNDSELSVNSMKMDSSVSNSYDMTSPLPDEKSEVIEISHSMLLEAVPEEDEEDDRTRRMSDDDHKTIPAEMYNDAHDTVPPPSSLSPNVKFTGEKETYRLASENLVSAAELTPPPLPSAAQAPPTAPPPSQPSPFGASATIGYSDELELPLLDDDDTSPASPIPDMDGPIMVSLQEQYPENAPTVPGHIAPRRTVPVEQTYGASQPGLAPPELPSTPSLDQHLTYPNPMQEAHINTEIQEDETGFSRFGIFFFVLGLFLIFGAGGIALFFKFVYLPKLQMEKIKTANQTPELPKVPTSSRMMKARPLAKTLVRTAALTKGANLKGAVVPPKRTPQSNIGTKPSARRATAKKKAATAPKRIVPKPRKRKLVRKRRKAPPPRRKRKKKTVLTRKPKKRKRRKKRRKKRKRRRVASLSKQPKRSGKGCPRGMTYIRSGSFKMGSSKTDEMRSFGELTLKWRRTSAYCIDRYEYPGRGRRPKTSVSFYQAKKLCEKRGKRLCTEQEWERACKGARNYRYPYGNKFNDTRCNTRRKSGENRSVTSSGRFRMCRSRYGVFDMSGNAAEWTSSRYRSGSSRTVRGGAANRPDWDVRCASRRALSPSRKRSTVGFRCCANP